MSPLHLPGRERLPVLHPLKEALLLSQTLSPWKGSHFWFKLITKQNKFLMKEAVEAVKQPSSGGGV